jgi:serine/threonine protein kinase
LQRQTFYTILSVVLPMLLLLPTKRSSVIKDVKPHNIFVHQDKVLLADYGLAMDCSISGITTTGELNMLTLKYAAPEMRIANFDIDSDKFNIGGNRKTDVFSLAYCFLEILATLNKQAVPWDPWAPGPGGSVIEISEPELNSSGPPLRASRYVTSQRRY